MPFDGTNPPAVDEVAIILRARHVLIRDGWCKKKTHNEWGNHCVMGSLYVAYNELTNTNGQPVALNATAFEAAHTIKKSLGIWCPLFAWNDSRGRHEEEVLLALKLAADWATERKLRGSLGARIKAAVLRMFRAAQEGATYDFGAISSRSPNAVTLDADSELPSPIADDAIMHHELEDA